MAEVPGDLAKLLYNPELWHRFFDVMRQWRSPGSDASFETDFRRFNCVKVRALCEELVIGRLPKPVPLASRQLAENARHQLSGVEIDSPEDRKDRVRRFIATSLAELECGGDPLSEGTLEFDLGRWQVQNESDYKKRIECDVLWESDYFILSAVATPDCLAPIGGHRVTATLAGSCSYDAVHAGETWLAKYIPSIAKTVAYCSVGSERAETIEELFADKRTYGIPRVGPAYVSFLCDDGAIGKTLFRESINALTTHCLPDSDCFTTRIGNAISMLAQADSTDAEAVALVLCFAAIEALLCTKPNGDCSWGVEKQVKKLVPALLRPNPTGRGIPGNSLHDLYCTRCYIVHQGRPDADHRELRDVRQVASGVLRAAIEWRRARVSQGEPSDWEDFSRELCHAATERRALSDVPDLSELLPGEQRRRQYRTPDDR